MRDGRYIFTSLILTVAQIVLNNYFSFSRTLLISVLPVLVLMLPGRVKNPWAMVLAFVLGLAVDFFAGALLGLTSAALVPVALAGRPLTSIAVGEEQEGRREELSFARAGAPRLSLACLAACAMYFAVFVWVDSAGTLGFWQAALRFLLSVLVSTPVCVTAAHIIRPE